MTRGETLIHVATGSGACDKAFRAPFAVRGSSRWHDAYHSEPFLSFFSTATGPFLGGIDVTDELGRVRMIPLPLADSYSVPAPKARLSYKSLAEGPLNPKENINFVLIAIRFLSTTELKTYFHPSTIQTHNGFITQEQQHWPSRFF